MVSGRNQCCISDIGVVCIICWHIVGTDEFNCVFSTSVGGVGGCHTGALHMVEVVAKEVVVVWWWWWWWL